MEMQHFSFSFCCCHSSWVSFVCPHNDIMKGIPIHFWAIEENTKSEELGKQ